VEGLVSVMGTAKMLPCRDGRMFKPPGAADLCQPSQKWQVHLSVSSFQQRISQNVGFSDFEHQLCPVAQTQTVAHF
jgi:hypothetical protein